MKRLRLQRVIAFRGAQLDRAFFEDGLVAPTVSGNHVHQPRRVADLGTVAVRCRVAGDARVGEVVDEHGTGVHVGNLADEVKGLTVGGKGPVDAARSPFGGDRVCLGQVVECYATIDHVDWTREWSWATLCAVGRDVGDRVRVVAADDRFVENGICGRHGVAG